MQIGDNHYDSGETAPGQADLARIVEQWIAAFNAHNVASISALYANDAELFDSGMRRARQGRDEITAWFTRRFRQMPAIQYTPIRYFLDGSQAAVCWLAEGKTPAFLRQRWLSRSFQVDGVSIFRTQDGLITWQHGYYDHLQMVERVIPPLRWLPLKL